MHIKNALGERLFLVLVFGLGIVSHRIRLALWKNYGRSGNKRVYVDEREQRGIADVIFRRISATARKRVFFSFRFTAPLHLRMCLKS